MKTIILYLSFPVACFSVGYGLGALMDYLRSSTKPGEEGPITRRLIEIDDWIWKNIYNDPLPPRVKAAEQNSVPRADDDEESIVVLETRDASPAHFLTKIESFSLFYDYGIDKYETREFEAGEIKWKLVIYPVDKEKGDHISVYLAMVETSSFPMDWELNAIFTIFLYNQISDKYLCFHVNQRRFNGTKFEWGFPRFISKKSLQDKSSGYLVDDNLVIGAEVFVLNRQRVVERVTLVKPSKYLRDWKIPEFSKLETIWTSEEYLGCGFNWTIRLIRKGDFTSKNNEVKIYLVCVSADAFATHQKVKATFCMRLIGRSDVVVCDYKFSHWFTLSDTTSGFSFKSLAEKDFLVEDCCTLQVEISVQVVV